MSSKFRPFFLFVLVFALCAGLSGLHQAMGQESSGAATGDATAEVADQEGEADEPTEDGGQESAAEDDSDWMQDVDAWFGSNLVQPMANTLFFDFFTGAEPSLTIESTSDSVYLQLVGDGATYYSQSEGVTTGPDGQLINSQGLPLLGKDGPIKIPDGVTQFEIVVDEKGIVRVDGNVVGRLDLVKIDDEQKLQKNSDGNLGIGDATAEPADGGVSTSDPVHFTTRWIASTRQSMGISSKGWLATSIPFVVVWLLLGGLFFTVKMAFINLRGFVHAIRLVKGDFDDPESEGDVSHFQALSAALSGTVGLGNIAGVAIAISQGGPGATFWMILIGLIGMTSKFTECTLGQMYRKIDPNGQINGGPMHYLKDGLADLGMKPLGIFLAFVFSVLCIGGSFGGGNTFQVVQSLGAISQDPNFSFLQEMPWIYGLVMVVMVGLVIIGGIQSIGKWAGRIVPLMCGVYVLFAVIIIAKNSAQVPVAISQIFQEAFTPDAAYGGFLGVLVIGITRAVFSNEAGTGSAAIAHSAAKTDVPVKEGIVALLEPFIDTVVVCSMTAIVLIITGAYNDPANAEIIGARNGAALTTVAFQQGGFAWFKYVLYLAMFLFAFSTCISWSYYGERCFTHWFGRGSSMLYKILFLIFTFLGSIISASNIQSFSDILILGMALPNILGVILLSGKVRAALDDYWGKVKSGEVQKKS